MASESTCRSKLAQLMSDHIFGNVNRNKFISVMNRNSMTYKIRRYH